jgi:WD40 repeat protein
VWNARTGRQLLVLAGHTRTVNDALFSRDGIHLLTGADDGARIWDVSVGGGRDALTFDAHHGLQGALAVAYSPDGGRLVTGGGGPSGRVVEASTGGSVCRTSLVRNAFTGCRVWKIEHHGDFYDVAFSPDEKRILFTGNGTPVIVHAVSGAVLVRIRRTLPDPFFPGAAWSPDGRRIALGGSDGIATMWDARSGNLLRSFRHSRDSTGPGTVNGVAFSPDGRRLATASWDHTAKIWDPASGRLVRTLSGDSDQVNRIAFSPDGTRVVTASSDGTARIWQLDSGRATTILNPGAGTIWDAEFSPDGKLIATAGDDSTARLWDAATGREVLKLTGASLALHDLAFSPDGSRLATASADGKVRVFLLRLDELVALARTRVTRGLTAAECRQYAGSSGCD